MFIREDDFFSALAPQAPLTPQQHQRALERSQGVTLVLGPTNTGKTHYGIERMLAYPNGMIGLPLRLLAREVYQRVVDKVGVEATALITGEEKIKPRGARYFICTMEAMPPQITVDFLALDEIQLAADFDRGHVFTDRLLNRRGRVETLLIGAVAMAQRLLALLPGATVVTRPRLSTLRFSGEKKIARLPPRSAIVAFSAEEVYAIAEWIRRQRGGAAVVLGALSPRTRNAQVALYQNGEVDYVVATDAIGMGLNLDVEHVAFAGDRKFDGWQYRRLHPIEFGQIAGRAGRFTRDGTFGTTGRCPPFGAELIEAIEAHRFDSVGLLQWRNSQLDFSSIDALLKTLDRLPDEPGLARAPIAIDQRVLEILSRDEEICRIAATSADIARLWAVCQIPDYRKLSPAAHAEMLASIFRHVVRAGHIPEDWLRQHIMPLDRLDGDIDTLSARIAHIRTWTFVANRADWLKNPVYWQDVARQVEDHLSDALHERLTQRFIDRRTSVLMRRLRENNMVEAEVTATGDVVVDGQHIGQLHGFRFTPDPQADSDVARTLNAAAQKALASEIEGRAKRVEEAVDEAFVLAHDGTLRWLGEAMGKITAGDQLLKPRVSVLADETLSGPTLEKVQRRLDLWLEQYITKMLGPVQILAQDEKLSGAARGIAFQLSEALGVLERNRVADQIKSLDQDGRASLRKLGVRFGAYHLYLPALLKPAPRSLAVLLWGLKHKHHGSLQGFEELPHLASSGRTSFAVDKDVDRIFYRTAGYRVCDERAVRVDILERLADLIRPAVAYRPGVSVGEPPAGAADGDGFFVTVPMTSLAGCAGENFAAILRSLGYASEQRPGPAISVTVLAEAARAPFKPQDIAAGGETQEIAPLSEPAEAEAKPEEGIDVGGAEPAVEAVGEVAKPLEEVAILTPVEAEAEPTQDAQAKREETAETTQPRLPVLIEVWRMQRHASARRERPFGKVRPQAREGEQNAVAGERIDRRPPRPYSKGGFRPHAPAQAGAEDAAVAERPQRMHDHLPRPHGRSGKPGQGFKHDGKPNHQAQKGVGKPRDRQPDPDSPFAKLAALKAQLENRNKGDK